VRLLDADDARAADAVRFVLRCCGLAVLAAAAVGGIVLDHLTRGEVAYVGADVGTYRDATAGVLTLFLVGVFLSMSLLLQRRRPTR
jgi:hypothetical protein